MKTQRKGIGRQRGFTLVEMSVTMVIAGLLFAAVTTGQELVAQAKATKLVGEIKLAEMQLQRYNQAKGRFPGDCNADGIIDYAADANAASVSLRGDTANASRAAEYSYSVLLPTEPLDGAEATAQENGCALNGDATDPLATVTTSTTNANVWLNDLKLAGVVSDSAPNVKLAKLVHEDFMFVGKVTDGGGESADPADYNAIVIHNVPQWMARRLSTAINGQDARADRSRLRLLTRTSTDGTYATKWDSATASPAAAEMRDSMVTVVYFFDLVPESQAGGASSI
ncbi:MAG: prepilin-type N-terminal cleavage/methylation domain-containing protein [Hydrogenophaga sp.]|uniref:type II secretion system protein n=1 Tax=Hydrogenophaga sp. TaxID=1904254 RepID=UPI0025C6FBCE|nr:prepilin-type N-terminal cleavage/methylation domain-containing protein [Hydrogenophaga sp.]MBT9550631.1 prepilin-type N-terminal cleavage/methylation domain-containing protein [Hydrogenophaga sp.]